jgi:methionyl aminopeptidase
MSQTGQSMGIILKSPQEIAIMQEAGRVVAAVLKALAEEARPGVKTSHLDDVAVDFLRKHGATASFLNYRGYPASVCVSINEEVVHGIPGQRTLVEGDIVSLDFGAKLEGFHADAALTVGVGEIRPEAREIIEVTRSALHAGIAAAKTGNRLGDISAAIQEYVESRGSSVVREWVGHGIGRQLHEDPQVPNFGVPGEGPLLQKGMTVALEPMVNAGGWRTRVTDNGWTVVTDDGSLSAHFEHTIAIDEDGAKILTGS